jgi:hypothetical protein
MNSNLLTVYTSPFKKVRLGKQYDGGYVICEIPNINYSILLSGGIQTDISFEEAFVTKYNTPCLAFDGTINAIPHTNKNIKFIKKNIGDVDSDTITNLHNLLESNKSIFIKMDIEGHELKWLRSLSINHLNNIDQFVIEFHVVFSENNSDIFDKINTTHVLVHFHPNNCCGTMRSKDSVRVPKLFECTYLHKKYFTAPPTLNNKPIPSAIDMQNVKSKPDIYINHPPFVVNNPNNQIEYPPVVVNNTQTKRFKLKFLKYH